jgi:DNA-directed RNA polymerase specialized sigma24 family protein
VEEHVAQDVLAGTTRSGSAAPTFEELFASEFPRVARTVHHIVGDRREADEITQDAFLELLRHWSKVAGYDRPDLWVRRIAIRKAQRERHRTWRRRELERSVAGVDGHEPPTPAPEVLAAVRRLAPKQRAAVVLFYFEDRPMAEIAEILGCSESTGWSQLHTARRHLAAALAEEEVADDVD